MKRISKKLMYELIKCQWVYEKSKPRKILRQNPYDEKLKLWYYEGRSGFDLLRIKNTKILSFSIWKDAGDGIELDNLEIIDIKKDDSNIIITCRDDIDDPETEFRFVFEAEKK